MLAQNQVTGESTYILRPVNHSGSIRSFDVIQDHSRSVTSLARSHSRWIIHWTHCLDRSRALVSVEFSWSGFSGNTYHLVSNVSKGYAVQISRAEGGYIQSDTSGHAWSVFLQEAQYHAKKLTPYWVSIKFKQGVKGSYILEHISTTEFNNDESHSHSRMKHLVSHHHNLWSTVFGTISIQPIQC